MPWHERWRWAEPSELPGHPSCSDCVLGSRSLTSDMVAGLLPACPGLLRTWGWTTKQAQPKQEPRLPELEGAHASAMKWRDVPSLCRRGGALPGCAGGPGSNSLSLPSGGSGLSHLWAENVDTHPTGLHEAWSQRAGAHGGCGRVALFSSFWKGWPEEPGALPASWGQHWVCLDPVLTYGGSRRGWSLTFPSGASLFPSVKLLSCAFSALPSRVACDLILSAGSSAP